MSSKDERYLHRDTSFPAFLDPYDPATFSKHEPVHSNMAIHATTPAAWESISKSRSFSGEVSPDQTYDGLSSPRARSCTFSFFNVNTDRVLFPFSRYPRHLEGGRPVKIVGIPIDTMLDKELSMFYIASTPTQFGGHSFKTVYRSHVTFVRKHDLTLALTLWQLVDKTRNHIFSINSDGSSSVVCTSVTVNGESFAHVVVASFLNGIDFASSDSSGVRAIDGVKLGLLKDGIQCPESQCATHVVSMPNLKKHFLTAKHVECEPLRCDECDATFYLHSDLERHVVNVHENNRFVFILCLHCLVLSDNILSRLVSYRFCKAVMGNFVDHTAGTL